MGTGFYGGFGSTKGTANSNIVTDGSEARLKFVKYTVKLMNKYLHGPIWVYDDEGVVRRKYPLIDSDSELLKLNEEARTFYDSFFSFDSGAEAYVFDEKGYGQNFDKMQVLIDQILKRLNEINNGSFIIEDYISKKE